MSSLSILKTPGTTTHSHMQYAYTHTSLDWVARDTTIGCLGDSVTPIPPVHQEESDRRGSTRDEAERCSCSYHSAWALPGVHQEPRWWGRCRVAGIRREAECESVGLALASERAESRPVRVHSPNSASGCDRSYLSRHRSLVSHSILAIKRIARDSSRG